MNPSSRILLTVLFSALLAACHRREPSQIGPAVPTPPPALDSATGIGNGGDVIDSRLRVTRSLVQHLFERIAAENPEKDLCDCPRERTGDFCDELRVLTTRENKECNSFLRSSAKDLASRAGDEVGIPLALSPNKLFVTDHHGKERPVLAKTELSSTGPISLDAVGVRALQPPALLFLLAHELGHKVSYLGKAIDDNTPTLSHPKPGGGRLLLDSMAAAITRYALDRGLVGTKFVIRDEYKCEITQTLLSTTRFVSYGHVDRDDTAVYRSEFGYQDNGFQCELVGTENSYRVRFRVEETQACHSQTWRETSTDLVQIIDEKVKVLFLDVRQGENPHCGSEKEIARFTTFQPEGSITFAVTYLGSKLVSSAAFRAD